MRCSFRAVAPTATAAAATAAASSPAAAAAASGAPAAAAANSPKAAAAAVATAAGSRAMAPALPNRMCLYQRAPAVWLRLQVLGGEGEGAVLQCGHAAGQCPAPRGLLPDHLRPLQVGTPLPTRIWVHVYKLRVYESLHSKYVYTFFEGKRW